MSQPDTDAKISFVSKDKDHLELVRDVMQSAHKIRCRSDMCFKLIIGGKRLWSGLANIGGIPAKSLIALMPNVPKEYLRHFVCGYIDGDGYVIWETTPRKKPIIGMLGGISFLESLTQLIDKQTGIGVPSLRSYNYQSPRVAYSGIKAKVLGKWMYTKTHIALMRKAIVARQFEEWKLSKYGWKSQAVTTLRMQQILDEEWV